MTTFIGIFLCWSVGYKFYNPGNILHSVWIIARVYNIEEIILKLLFFCIRKSIFLEHTTSLINQFTCVVGVVFQFGYISTIIFISTNHPLFSRWKILFERENDQLIFVYFICKKECVFYIRYIDSTHKSWRWMIG